MWHAEADLLVGNMSKYIADNLPSAQVISLPETGHLWVLDHMKDVLEPLISQDETGQRASVTNVGILIFADPASHIRFCSQIFTDCCFTCR